MNQKGLGKGLSALFMEQESASQPENLQMVKLAQVEPNPAQPRREFDPEALSELAESIRTHGILQPLAVRRVAGDRYQIIAGERRWRAAREAGVEKIPVYLVDADDRTVMELALVENLQRQDLSPIEEAEGYRTLMDDFSLTQDDVAKRVGKSRPTIANALRLLSLSPNVRDLVASGALSVGHAKALLALTDAEQQKRTAELVLEKGYSVRQTELLIKKILQDSLRAQEKRPEITVNYLEEIERRLAAKLGRRVKLVSGRKKGRIELEFYDPEDLEKLIDFLDTCRFQSQEGI